MSRIDYQAAKEQIRQAIDMVDLAGSYLALHRQGRGFVGLCPWHDDARPSLQVNPERQSFKCWVCDVGGDVFSFVMKMENVEFREAMEMLADRAGIALQNVAPSDSDNPFDRRRLLQATSWVESQFHACLLSDRIGEPARRYLRDRGITAESIERFKIGYAPLEWDWLLRRAATANIAAETLERVDCLVRRERGGFYDRFRGRVMFSIRDVRSRAIAFGGRVLPSLARDDDAKYVNSRETPLFSKSGQLYGLDLARDAIAREGSAVVMEGYTDVVMAHQHGVQHAVAVLGTALGERHVPLLRRFTENVTLVLDGDAAGKGRTLDILDKLLALFVTHELELKILTLPEGADPCDVIATQGSNAFRRLLNQAKDALTHKIEAVTQGLATAADPHRSSQAVESILATLARMLPRAASAASTAFVREQQSLVRIAREFGIAQSTLQDRLSALRNAQRPVLRSVDQRDAQAPARTPARLSAWEREFFELLLHEPRSHETLLAEVGETDFSSPAAGELYRLVREQSDHGAAPTFEALMVATDDPALKNLLVDCDAQGREKSASDFSLRLSDLLATLAARRGAPRRQAWMAELHSKKMDSNQENETLNALFEELKSRQAGIAPTDG